MSNDWKIYTKTGDGGQTSLIGGDRVPKYHERIEAYGTIDELNSFIGLVRDTTEDVRSREVLLEIQDRLFTIESLFAAVTEEALAKLPKIFESDIRLLETEIDRMNESLPQLSSFVLPGGNPLVSNTHIARTVCRRAERCMVKIQRDLDSDKFSVKYVNRLSDYLFVLARKFVMDSGVNEIIWKPRFSE
jgi:cob(I)alamin adenosyltransferase